MGDTKKKAQERLQLLNETKEAFIGYAEDSETIATDFEKDEEEIKKVKKIFNLEAANADLSKRKEILKSTEDTINGLFDTINKNYNTMAITIPEDKKKILQKEIKAVEAKLEVLMTCAATEQDLLPQGEKVPADAQVFKDELARIIKYVEELQANTKIECDKYSNDVKFWAEYRTGIKEFSPWLASAEKAATEGLSKPSSLDEVKALNDKVTNFDKSCVNYLKVLEAAKGASQKMTTHKEADDEVSALRERFDKVKAVSETWVKKCEVLVKEWVLLDNTVTELNSWVAKDKSAEGENQFSLEKMESTLGELKNIFKQ